MRREHRNDFWRAIGFQPALQRLPLTGGHDLLTAVNLNADDRLAALAQQRHPHGKLRNRFVENECRQTIDIAMPVTDPSHHAIVFDTKVQRTAFGIGHRHHIVDDFVIGLRALAFAFELHRQAFLGRQHRLFLSRLSIILTC